MQLADDGVITEGTLCPVSKLREQPHRRRQLDTIFSGLRYHKPSRCEPALRRFGGHSNTHDLSAGDGPGFQPGRVRRAIRGRDCFDACGVGSWSGVFGRLVHERATREHFARPLL